MKRELKVVGEVEKMLRKHKPFNLYIRNYLVSKFKYNKKFDRYECSCGYLTMRQVEKLATEQKRTRRIEWLG